jgi:hypothetical protein
LIFREPLATAPELSLQPRYFERINLVNALYQGSPGHPAFPPESGVRLGLCGRHSAEMILSCKPFLLFLIVPIYGQ